MQRPQEGGFLDQHGIALVQKDAPQQIERLLRAASDDNVLHRAGDALRCHIAGDGLAQRGESVGDAILQRLARHLAQHIVADLFELRHRKESGLWPAASHGDDIRGLRHLENIADHGRGHAGEARGVLLTPLHTHCYPAP